MRKLDPAAERAFSKLTKEQMDIINELRVSDPDIRISEAWIMYTLAKPKCEYCGDVIPFALRYAKHCDKLECRTLSKSRARVGDKISKKLSGTHLSKEAKKNIGIGAKKRNAENRAKKLIENKVLEAEYYINPKLCGVCGNPIKFDANYYRRYKKEEVSDISARKYCSDECSKAAAFGHVHNVKSIENMKHAHKSYNKQIEISISFYEKIKKFFSNLFNKLFTKKVVISIKPSKAHLNTLKKRLKNNDERLEKYLYTMIDKIGRNHSTAMIGTFDNLYERKKQIENEINEVKKALKKK